MCDKEDGQFNYFRSFKMNLVKELVPEWVELPSYTEQNNKLMQICVVTK
jgi:hypothetical protein